MQTFAGKGKRNFKKKRDLPSLQYSRNGFSIKDGRLRLAGGTLIPGGVASGVTERAKQRAGPARQPWALVCEFRCRNRRRDAAPAR